MTSFKYVLMCVFAIPFFIFLVLLVSWIKNIKLFARLRKMEGTNTKYYEQMSYDSSSPISRSGGGIFLPGGKRVNETAADVYKRITKLNKALFILFTVCFFTPYAYKTISFMLSVKNPELSKSFVIKSIKLKLKNIPMYPAITLNEMISKGAGIEEIEEALRLGADVNEKEKDTFVTPLMNAASWAGPDEMAFLLEHGARLEEKDRFGNTAINKAATWYKLENVRFLASKGLDLNSPGYAGYTPLVSLLHNWNTRQQSFEKWQLEGRRLTHKNLRSRELETNRIRALINYLIEQKVATNIPDIRGNTAVTLSAGTEFEAAVKALDKENTEKRYSGMLGISEEKQAENQGDSPMESAGKSQTEISEQ